MTHTLVGCYIDNAVPRELLEITEALLDILVMLGGSRDTWDVDAIIADVDEVDVPQVLYEIDLEIEAKINEYLPDDLVAGWYDGDFLIVPIDEDEE